MSTYKYNPDDANPVLQDGEYDAVIQDAKVGETKKGDPKVQVTVKVYGPNNIRPLVHDHIIAPYGIRRLKQLCEALGVDFDSGEVDPTKFVGRNLRVQLRTQADDAFGDRNVVSRYLPDKGDELDEATAYSAYANAVRANHADTTDDLLLKNWSSACDKLGKPKSQFTSTDWLQVREEANSEFVPF